MTMMLNVNVGDDMPSFTVTVISWVPTSLNELEAMVTALFVGLSLYETNGEREPVPVRAMETVMPVESVSTIVGSA
jgi:hypothetical protein